LHRKAQLELLNHIKQLLKPQGILFVSSVETEMTRKAGFEPVSFPGANAFKLKQLEKNGEKQKREREGSEKEFKHTVQEKEMIREELEDEKKQNRSDSEVKSSQQSDFPPHLFERRADEEYIKEWTELLQQASPVTQTSDKMSVLVFRLGQEWLALSTMFLKEVIHRRTVHGIPHRNSKILQGIVNLNGELKLSVSLHELLQIERSQDVLSRTLSYQSNRMVAIVKEGELWVFPVDEIDGIYHWNLLDMKNVPVNLSKSFVNYIKGMMEMENKSIGLIDEELLFAGLKRSIH
jgi:chemotaxis-related protein WspD